MNTADLAVRLTLMIQCVGIAITGLEILRRRHEHADDGMFSRSLMAIAYPIGNPDLWELLRRVFRVEVFIALIVGQIVVAIAILLSAGTMPGLELCVTYLLGVHLLTHLRVRHGFDGSDQMRTIVLAGACAYLWATTSMLREVAILFICGQLILSYVTSGVAKLIAREWRSGQAIVGILATQSYGMVWVTRRLVRHRWLSITACWATIVFEIGVPGLVLCGPVGLWACVACGVVFHGSIAAMMGLNGFFWSFMSAYPVLAVVIGQLSGLMGHL